MPDSVAATLVRALGAQGVRRIFGIPGGGSSLDLIEAGAEQGIDFVPTRTEAAAAIMAATTAELTGTPGVVLTGLGPGAAAVTNGLAHAALDRAPLVLITDSYPPATKRFASHQQIDHAALFAPLVKASCTLTGQTAPDALAGLLDAAVAPPQGPVHIDLSSQAAAESMAEPMADPKTRSATAPARGAWQVGEAQALLAGSDRPVLLVGLEARRAVAAARALAAELAGPVLTTWKAKGVVADDDPLCVGLFAGGEAEAACVGEADLIVQLGFDPIELIPQRWRYHAPIIDLATVSHAHDGEPAARVIGPLDQAAEALTGVVRRQGWRPGEIEGFREQLTGRHTMSASAAIGPQQVVEAVAVAAPPGTRACIDAGAHMFPAMAFWPARAPHAVLISNGLATMGFALPAAIAAALQEPTRPVVALVGDGGLAMVIGELATAVEQGCAPVVVVFNDAALSLIALKQQGRGLAARGSRSRAVDFAAAARAFGFAACRIERADALRPALMDAFGSGAPTLIDVQVDPQGYLALVRSLRG